jgi:hypothetical protein
MGDGFHPAAIPRFFAKVLRWGVRRLEAASELDRAADLVQGVAEPLLESSAAPILRGDWLGHALHPISTDVPLACWLAAGRLDLAVGKSSGEPARILVGTGLLAAIPTMWRASPIGRSSRARPIGA